MPVTSSDRERRTLSQQEDNIGRPTDTTSRPLPISCSGKDCVDVASEDSFPASDAPGWTVVMGTGSPHPRGRD